MMGEDSFLDSYWELHHELAQFEEPPYDCSERPCPEDEGEKGFPYTVPDLSDDADALSSAGWGMDEDYGGYSSQ
jgi:hypothetical protein